MADANDPFGMGNAQSMMGMDPAKMTETFRSMTQKSMEQSKEAYGRMKSAADEANADLGFQHLDALMGAKSFSEVIEMQTSYVRQQAELATSQAKELQSLTQSVAQEMMKPSRDVFEKASQSVVK